MSADRWLRRITRDEPAELRARLVCFPHGGGNASYFAPWARAVPDDVELLAVRYAGRESRFGEPPPPDVQSVAADVADALRVHDDGRTPLVLFGHSLGALVAYETARRHRADLLAVSGRHAPVEHRDGTVHLLGDEGVLAAMEDMGGDIRVLRTSPELRRCLLPVIREDFRIAETYRHDPAPRLECDVLAVLGDADPLLDREAAARWAGCTTGAFTLEVRPGGHFYLDDQVEDLVSLVLGGTPGPSDPSARRRAPTDTSVAPTTMGAWPAK